MNLGYTKVTAPIAGSIGKPVMPDPRDVKGFSEFFARHEKGLRSIFAGWSDADVARLDALLDRLRTSPDAA